MLYSISCSYLIRFTQRKNDFFKLPVWLCAHLRMHACLRITHFRFVKIACYLCQFYTPKHLAIIIFWRIRRILEYYAMHCDERGSSTSSDKLAAYTLKFKSNCVCYTHIPISFATDNITKLIIIHILHTNMRPSPPHRCRHHQSIRSSMVAFFSSWFKFHYEITDIDL